MVLPSDELTMCEAQELSSHLQYPKALDLLVSQAGNNPESSPSCRDFPKCAN